MQLEIENKEMWPVYYFRKPDKNVFSEYVMEIHQELYDEYLKAFEEFERVQKNIEKFFLQAKKMETERYYNKMEEPRQSKIITVEYAEEEDQVCSLCEQKQTKGIYQGGNYVGCEKCFEIKPPEHEIRPNLLQDSLAVSRFSQDTGGVQPAGYSPLDITSIIAHT